jgi:DNA-binding beta-propeller fold protein YncE
LSYVRGNAHFTVFDLDQSRAVKVFNFNEPGLNLTDLAIAPDRKTVYLSTTKFLKVFDTTANQFAPGIPIASAGLAIAPNGKQLYAAGGMEGGGGDSGTVDVIDTLTNRITRSIAPNVPAGLGFALSPDGRRLYCPNGPGFSVIDADTGNLLFQTTAPADLDLQGASEIRITPEGKRVFVVSSSEEPSVVIVDTDTNRMIGHIGSRGGLVDIAFAPSGARGYILDNDGAAVRVISIESNMTLKEFATSLDFAQGIVSRCTLTACTATSCRASVFWKSARRAIRSCARSPIRIRPMPCFRSAPRTDRLPPMAGMNFCSAKCSTGVAR